MDATQEPETSGGRTPRRGLGPLEACPTCGGSEFVAVVAEDEVNFLCEVCSRCWHVEMARVNRVDPVTCPGCPYQSRCLARLDEDGPEWQPSGRAATAPRPPRSS